MVRIFYFFVFIFLLSSCSEWQVNQPDSNGGSTVSPKDLSSELYKTGRWVKLNDVGDHRLAHIQYEEKKTTIHLYQGKIEAKHEYSDGILVYYRDGAPFARVNYSKDGSIFILPDAGERPWSLVYFPNGKIHIMPPKSSKVFHLRLESDKYLIKESQAQPMFVNYSKDHGTIGPFHKSHLMYRCTDMEDPLPFAVLGVTDIPLPLRYIFLTELLRKK